VKVVPPLTNATTAGVVVALDNNVDDDNNGLQPGGLNSALFSPLIQLTSAAEPSADGDSDLNTDWTMNLVCGRGLTLATWSGVTMTTALAMAPDQAWAM